MNFVSKASKKKKFLYPRYYYEIIWFKARMRSLWYYLRHEIRIGYNHSLLPSLGRGPYVDVLRRGDYIDIVDHHEGQKPFTVRLVPCKDNHGVMVEHFNAVGRLVSRVSCDSKMFLSMSAMGAEAPESCCRTSSVEDGGRTDTPACVVQGIQKQKG